MVDIEDTGLAIDNQKKLSRPVPLKDGVKYDDGKLRFDLFPAKALGEVAGIFTYGANKYADRNWEKGIKYGRVFAAAMRHLWLWWAGERIDIESGKPHLAHAIVCLLFLLHYEMHDYQQFDDRPKQS